MKKKINERREGFMRLVVGVVSGIILGVWKYLIYLFWIINFFVAIFSGKRSKHIAEMSEVWNSQVYIFLRYMNFVSNVRPFPFEKREKNLSKFN